MIIRKYSIGMLIDKVTRVVNSCTTLEQMIMARNYSNSVMELIKKRNLGYHTNMLYANHLYNVYRVKYNDVQDEKNKTTLAHISSREPEDMPPPPCTEIEEIYIEVEQNSRRDCPPYYTTSS